MAYWIPNLMKPGFRMINLKKQERVLMERGREGEKWEEEKAEGGWVTLRRRSFTAKDPVTAKHKAERNCGKTSLTDII